MLSDTMLSVLNDQLKMELSASYNYLAMAAWGERVNYPGLAKWMFIQEEEEHQHAMKIFQMINNLGGKVALMSLPQPSQEFKDPLDVFETSLQQEQENTKHIHKVYETAHNEKDYAVQVQIQWFVTEQVEEEKLVSDIVDQLKRINGDPTGLLILDRELGVRQPKVSP